jgi:uncharacterized protein
VSDAEATEHAARDDAAHDQDPPVEEATTTATPPEVVVATPDPAVGAPGDADAGRDATASDAPAPPPTKFSVLEVVSVSYELPSPNPVIHLMEEGAPYRSLYFPIGLPEAQSIALALAEEPSPRPSTHDLLVAVLAAAGCDVVAVRLTGERGGTILAELDVMGPRGHEVIDCRPTDGIAVALRLKVKAPILAADALYEQ